MAQSTIANNPLVRKLARNEQGRKNSQVYPDFITRQIDRRGGVYQLLTNSTPAAAYVFPPFQSMPVACESITDALLWIDAQQGGAR